MSEQKNSRYSVNGSFAEYALAQADFLGRIPTNLGFVEAAPILCAGVTTYRGPKETATRPGEWVVISGAGGLGHIAIEYAKAMGPHVAAVDPGQEKAALAKSSGPRSPSTPGPKTRPARYRSRSAGRMECW